MHAERLTQDFTRSASEKLALNLKQITRCANLLDDEELWQRANAHCNSVGNLILHLTGNVRQWVLAGIAGEPFDRDRAAEFAQRGPLSAEQVVAALQQIVSRAIRVISGLSPADVSAARKIQGYELSTLSAVFHVVEHFSCHTGQIVHMTKVLRDVDLSLYDTDGRRLSGDAATP